MTLNKKIEELWNKYSPEKEFGREMFNKTMKYQKKYNFKSEHGTMKQMPLNTLLCKQCCL